MSFGPLNTLALASADVAGKEGEGAAGKPVPRAAPIKQEEGRAHVLWFCCQSGKKTWLTQATHAHKCFLKPDIPCRWT
eukprot:scaffold80891_cov19-Tisochrysis_lutea.AAC.1